MTTRRAADNSKALDAFIAAKTEIDAMLARIQNELFDLGAELATPDTGKPLPDGSVGEFEFTGPSATR